MIKTYMTRETFNKLVKNTMSKYDYSKKDVKSIIKKLNIQVREENENDR